MKRSLKSILLISCFLIFTEKVFAMPLDKLQVYSVPASGDPVSGISEGVHLVPFGQQLDDAYRVEFSLNDLQLPNELYRQHVSIFHWNEGYDFENKYLGGFLEGDMIYSNVFETGIYFLQPVIPLDDLVLNADSSKFLGTTFRVSSEKIISNEDVLIWDDFPFWVQVKNGKIPNATFNDEKQAFRILSDNGKLDFQVLPEIPGVMHISVFTDFGIDAASGFLELDVLDSTDVVLPPKSLKIQGSTLSWDRSPDNDIAAYLLVYKLKGQADWNGVDIIELPSPISISPNGNAYSLRFGAYSEDVVYEIGLKALDVLGHESPVSNLLTYEVPVQNFDAIKEMIRREVELESILSNEVIFPDISTHWAREYILKLVQLGVVNGYEDGNFGPDDPVTRAQLVKIVLNAFGYAVDLVVPKSSFHDVKADDWFSPFLEVGRKENILSGYADGTFRPYDSINRAEGLKILINAAKITVDDATQVHYDDVDKKQWYMPYLTTATQKGIVSGSEVLKSGRTLKYFYPISPLTRGEVAKIVVKMLEE
jgi:hypothetical protein